MDCGCKFWRCAQDAGFGALKEPLGGGFVGVLAYWGISMGLLRWGCCMLDVGIADLVLQLVDMFFVGHLVFSGRV